MNELELAKHLINDLGIDKDKVAKMINALKELGENRILIGKIEEFLYLHSVMTWEDYESIRDEV